MMKSLKCSLGYHTFEKKLKIATHLYDQRTIRFLQRCKNCEKERVFDKSEAL